VRRRRSSLPDDVLRQRRDELYEFCSYHWPELALVIPKAKTAEEVRKGMREKAEQGIYPSRPPLGYRNNKLDHSIEIDPEKASIARRIFEIYATGQYSLSAFRKQVQTEIGRRFPKGYLHKLLRNLFYGGYFVWGDETYRGTHPLIVDSATFQHAQEVLARSHRPKSKNHQFAFSGLLFCAHDKCAVTAEIKKGKYVYYHCTGYRGKCDLPYVREEVLGLRLAQVLKDIHIPDRVLAELQESLTLDSGRIQQETQVQRARLEQRLSSVRRRIEQAYLNKLDGKITEEFWTARNREWLSDERQILLALEALKQANPDRLLTASRILELANKAHSLYLMQNPTEQGKLLKMVLSNCAMDGASLYPTYRKPFDMIFQRVKTEEWRARRDSNSRPIAPEAIALSS
jgi:site-specific DNA recombinase